MLFILAFSLVIASVFLIIYRKNKDSILWLGLCTSLMLELCGVMLFIAKKGGISQEVLTFLYFSRNIYRKMQYFLITLGQLGYLIAIGRSLFPFFLLRIAMNYSMLPGLRKRKTWVKLSRVIPIMSLILYFPSVYRMIVHNRESMQEIIAYDLDQSISDSICGDFINRVFFHFNPVFEEAISADSNLFGVDFGNLSYLLSSGSGAGLSLLRVFDRME